MMWFHSTLHVYGFEVEQIPLPPRHAHNASDRCVDLYCRAQLRPRMIARLNRFFRRMMRTHHILGAKQFYDTISMASPSSFSGQRLVNRCHVLYRHFKVADFIAPTAPSLNLSRAIILGRNCARQYRATHRFRRIAGMRWG